MLDSYLPDAVFGEEHMWAAYLIVGLVFVITGAVLWRRRRSTGEEAEPRQG
jgi:LPXTG-motif cell wall-anchored protein